MIKVPSKFLALVAFYASAIAFAQIQNPANLATLKGKTLKEYPELMLTVQDPYANIYWSNNVSCDHEPETCKIVVDQDAAFKIQEALKSQVLLRLKKFDQIASKAMPRWNQIRQQLFPLSLYVTVGEEMEYAGANFYTNASVNVFSASGTKLGEVPEKARIRVGSIKSVPAAVSTIALHEFGHMLLRASGFPYSTPKSGSLTAALQEESLADFIGVITNENTPYIGPGLQAIIKQDTQAKVNDPKLDPMRKAFFESHLRGFSDKALRDFSIRKSLEDAYLLPGAYNGSNSLNSLLWQILVKSDAEAFRNVVLNTISENPSVLMDGNLVDVVKGIMRQYHAIDSTGFTKNYPSIKAVIQESGWKDSVLVPGEIGVSVSTSSQDPKAFDVTLSSPVEKNKLFLTTMRSVTYTLYSKDRARFSIAQFMDFDASQYFQLTPASRCDEKDLLCICGENKNTLSVNAVYLNTQKQLVRVNSTPVPSNHLGGSDCYTLTVGWK